MSYHRDKDSHTRGSGAIAAADYGNPRRARERQLRLARTELADTIRAGMTYGPRGGMGLAQVAATGLTGGKRRPTLTDGGGPIEGKAWEGPLTEFTKLPPRGKTPVPPSKPPPGPFLPGVVFQPHTKTTPFLPGIIYQPHTKTLPPGVDATTKPITQPVVTQDPSRKPPQKGDRKLTPGYQRQPSSFPGGVIPPTYDPILSTVKTVTVIAPSPLPTPGAGIITGGSSGGGGGRTMTVSTTPTAPTTSQGPYGPMLTVAELAPTPATSWGKWLLLAAAGVGVYYLATREDK